MRETSVSDEDLAIQTAKQQLVALKDRAGYAEAVKKEPYDPAGRIFCLLAAAACGGIVYACTLYITAAWLRWFFIVIFSVLGLGMLLAIIGFSPKLTPVPWGVAILEKKIVDDDHRITFLRETGEQHDLKVNENIYNSLRPGDLGVVKVTGTAPDFTVDSFVRL